MKIFITYKINSTPTPKPISSNYHGCIIEAKTSHNSNLQNAFHF